MQYPNRVTKLQNQLKEKKIDAILVSSLPNITYLTGFSGFSREDRDAFLLICQNEQYIFTHGIYKEAAQTFIPSLSLIAIHREQPVSQSIQDLANKHNLQTIAFDPHNLSVAEYTSFAKQVGKSVLIPDPGMVEELRVYKSEDEINTIQKACAIGDEAFSHLCNTIKEGMSEQDVALTLELCIRKQDATISFPTIAAFGSNASRPHHQTSDKKLTKNTLVLVDFGVSYKNYCSDMTRTFFFGQATDDEKRMYETTLTAQQKAIEYLTTHLDHPRAKEADKIARDYIISQGFPPIPHSLGHGIGLEVHEAPRLTPFSTEVLQESMVFSVEPGIYLPNVGGVRIEDLFAIHNTSLLQLTTSPKELIELS